MKNEDITVNELAIKANITLRALERHIKNLKKGGRLERIGSTKSGKWKIKINKQ